MSAMPLAWVNPVLGGVAALLAMLVIAVAAERFPARVRSCRPNGGICSFTIDRPV